MLFEQDKKGMEFSMIIYLIIGIFVLLLLTIFFTKGFGRADDSVNEVTSPDTLFNKIGGAVSSLFDDSNQDATPHIQETDDSLRGIQNE